MATSVTSMNNFPCFKITATKAVTKQEGPKNFLAESFFSLPAVKKDSKTVQLEIFLALLILTRL